MNKSAFVLIVSVIGFLSGCASTMEPVKIGENKYQTGASASPIRGGHAAAREIALQEAQDKCKSMGKVAEYSDIQLGSYFTRGTATVTFSCN